MSVDTRSPLQQQLGFYTADPYPSSDRLPGPALASPEGVRSLLDRVGALLGTEKPAVAASQFSKWYCRSLVSVLYEFSVLGVARSASLRDVTVLFPGEPPFAVLGGGRATTVPDDASRESLRELTVIRLFAHNWNLVFKSLREATGVKDELLWENGSMYLNYFYRLWISEAQDAALRERLEDDYRYIQREAPPELYGELQCFNPFAWTGKEVRRTCCLRYHLPDGGYCKGCPITHANGEA